MSVPRSPPPFRRSWFKDHTISSLRKNLGKRYRENFDHIGRSNEVSNNLMHVTDWLPTFLSMAGANSSEILPNIDGIDQWQSLKQNSTHSPRSELLYNIDPHPPGKINKV